MLYTCRPSGALGELGDGCSIHMPPRWGYAGSLVHWLIELMNTCLNQEDINAVTQ